MRPSGLKSNDLSPRSRGPQSHRDVSRASAPSQMLAGPVRGSGHERTSDDIFWVFMKDLGCSYCCKSFTNNDASTEVHVQPVSHASHQGKKSKASSSAARSGEHAHLPDVSNAVRRPKVTFRDGRTYEGQWRGSMRHGDGKECSKLGDFTYEGQFREDMYHGFGTMRWSNGSKYIGNFRENQKHGWGHEFYPHGESYQGCFHNGQIDGYGTYYFKDGTTISGQWKDGRLLTSVGTNTPRMTTPTGTPVTTPPRTPNSSPIPFGTLPPPVV
eukprot:GHVS01026775.1.p1 GENE.GHVS01026775.1~~GHVS01026775.1.p1  ORF type:complete len:270 (+),score=15.03 GHVS01026775.1:544-1353(+)